MPWSELSEQLGVSLRISQCLVGGRKDRKLEQKTFLCGNESCRLLILKGDPYSEICQSKWVVTPGGSYLSIESPPNLLHLATSIHPCARICSSFVRSLPPSRMGLQDRLLHGDLHPGNLFVDLVGPEEKPIAARRAARRSGAVEALAAVKLFTTVLVVED